jgi:phosphoglycolate phosphatase
MINLNARSEYQHIIFDLDGTLIDSAPSILHCLGVALKKNKLESKIPLTNSIIGPPLVDTLKLLAGADSPLILDELVDSFKDAYDGEGYKASIPYKGADEMLRALNNSDISVHVATNKRIIPTKKIIEHLSWGHFFNSIYALDAGGIRFNSKSDLLISIIKEKNLNPLRTVYVGDIKADYEAAKKAGMQFIFVEWGYEKNKFSQFPVSVADTTELTKKILYPS